MNVASFEVLEDFLRKLEQITDKENPVFVSKQKLIDDSGTLTGAIILQTVWKDILYQYKHTEGILPVVTTSKISSDVIKTTVDPETAVKIETAMTDKFKIFEQQLNDEFSKASQVIRSKGFSDIVNAVLTTA
jgi:hypothetical protein